MPVVGGVDGKCASIAAIRSYRNPCCRLCGSNLVRGENKQKKSGGKKRLLEIDSWPFVMRSSGVGKFVNFTDFTLRLWEQRGQYK